MLKTRRIIDWVEVLHHAMCNSGYLRCSCKDHEVGCLWIVLLKPNTGVDKQYENQTQMCHFKFKIRFPQISEKLSKEYMLKHTTKMKIIYQALKKHALACWPFTFEAFTEVPTVGAEVSGYLDNQWWQSHASTRINCLSDIKIYLHWKSFSRFSRS